MSDANLNIVKKIVSEKFKISESMISDETNFVKDFGADSIDLVEIVVDIEKEFGIDIPDDMNGNFVNIKNMLDFLNKNMNSRKL